MRQAQTLTDADIKRVLSFCQARKHSTRDSTIIQFSILAGLRAKELAALRVGDVYAADGTVRDQFVLSSEQTKGGAVRRVYVNAKLQRVLKQYRAHLQNHNPTAPLFPTQLGTEFSANTMCQLFLDIYKSCGLRDASSHSGRRTFITRLAARGVGVRVLAALAGHQHISTTQRYIDVNDAQLAGAVELI